MTDYDPEPQDENLDLRNRIAKLEAALAHERKEREALQRLVIPDQVEVRRNVEILGKDFELTMAAVDARLHELAERGGDENLQRPMLDGMLAMQATLKTLLTSVLALAGRIERIERLIAPALRGEVKLLAQQV